MVSLWQDMAVEPARATGIRDGARYDVAIVGGGYTGLSTALHCVEKGLSACVLEAHEIGFGGSGRNVGLVNAGLWLPPAKLRAALGPDYGPRLLRLLGEAPRTVFDLIERHQIRCAPTRTGTLHAAHAASGLRDLRARHADWARLEAPVSLLDAEEMRRLTGSDAFPGGLLDKRAGTVNPAAYARGLARAAAGAGAEIATGVRVTRLDRDDGGWSVVSNEGRLKAAHVVLGTNAYSDTLWPGLDRLYTIIRFFQIATDPIDAPHILPERQGLWTTAPIMTALRRDAEGRLILGSMGRLHGTTERGLTRRWAARQLQKLYPSLGPVRFASAWDGAIAMTPDHLPRIHRLAPGLWTPIAYNGRGITTGTIFGQAMADLLAGMDPDDLPLPVTDPRTVPRARLAARAYDAVFAAHQGWKAL
jgi:glycine/D-amino acid oxidase-like deaminating enzyme